MIDIEEHQRLRRIAEDVEDAWLNRLADEATSDTTSTRPPTPSPAW
ncbi:hypothetical protein [Streptomyces mangrovi]|nr:hypothetical protein [Streptomyces pini]